jgi:poly(3-hydroxybutyrate) depolymerase
MKALLLTVMGVAFCAAPLRCASAKVTRESIDVEGAKRVFYLFVPATPPPAGGFPLLVLLHGSGRDGSSLVDKWKDLAAKEGFLLAGPNSAKSAYWNALTDGPDLLYAIVERLKNAYPVNARRVYLFGHSAGAVFTIAMSSWEPEYFAAAALHAGAFRSPEEVQVAGDLKRAIPLAMYSGTDDPFFPIANVRSTADILRKAGLRVTLTEMPHHDHNYYVVASKLNESIWTFFKENELPVEPRFVRRSFAR